MRIPLIVLSYCLLALAMHAAPSTEVRLLLDHKSARPGDTVLAGLELKMQPHWHTYWQNPGASGDPTKIEWSLPPGYQAGPIEWPLPEKYDFAGLATYVYHDTAILLIPIKVPTSAKPGPVKLSGKAFWLE